MTQRGDNLSNVLKVESYRWNGRVEWKKDLVAPSDSCLRAARELLNKIDYVPDVSTTYMNYICLRFENKKSKLSVVAIREGEFGFFFDDIIGTDGKGLYSDETQTIERINDFMEGSKWESLERVLLEL